MEDGSYKDGNGVRSNEKGVPLDCPYGNPLCEWGGGNKPVARWASVKLRYATFPDEYWEWYFQGATDEEDNV